MNYFEIIHETIYLVLYIYCVISIGKFVMDSCSYFEILNNYVEILTYYVKKLSHYF